MLIIPLYPDLRIGGKPVVTVSIIALCILMHLASDETFHERFMYYPDSLNLFRMISSGLIHADWRHLIGNMIGYFAFGVALEILIGNALLYLAIMVSITVVSSLSYSLYTAVFGSAYPTLGFSDVVFGMIGLSAYLMPRARIRTVVWAFAWVWAFFMPTWVIAGWYVGWNLYDLFIYGNESSINIVSHVSGALTGYCLGRWWLSGRKIAIQDDLDDEIDYMRSARSSAFGGPGSYIYRQGLKEMKEAEADAGRTKAFDDMLGKVERLNGTDQYADALSLLVEGIRDYGENEDVLSYVFETVLAWRKSYFTLCYARHYITYLLARKEYKEALKVCEACFAFAPEFVLANPLDVIPLAKMAEKQGRYALAHSLVRDAEERYGDGLDVMTAGLMEARLLAHHLDQPAAAKKIVQGLLDAGKDLPVIRRLPPPIRPMTFDSMSRKGDSCANHCSNSG
jgi:membrane associated rhomboid family serine protease